MFVCLSNLMSFAFKDVVILVINVVSYISVIVEAVDGCNLMEATWTPSSKTRTLKILVGFNLSVFRELDLN